MTDWALRLANEFAEAARELQALSGVSTQIVAAKQRALAVGALALGAFALGALALGMLVIGRLAVGRARIRRLEVDELVLGRLRMEPQWGPGSQKNAGQTEKNRGQTPPDSSSIAGTPRAPRG